MRNLDHHLTTDPRGDANDVWRDIASDLCAEHGIDLPPLTIDAVADDYIREVQRRLGHRPTAWCREEHGARESELLERLRAAEERA